MEHDDLIDRARAAHPHFSVDASAFALHLQRHQGVAPQHVADLYLAFACAQGERRALATFEEQHLALVNSFIAHLRQSEPFVDEVRQRLRVRLLLASPAEGRVPKLLDYSGRGSLGGWVRVAAVRQALDLLDADKPPADSADSEDDLLAVAADPEVLAIRERHLPQFRQAFAAALGALEPRERNLLRFYLVDGLNLARIAEIFGKSRATAGRMIVDCREKLLDQTRQRLAVLTGAPQDEVASLIRLLQSQLDVSIRGILLREPAPEKAP